MGPEADLWVLGIALAAFFVGGIIKGALGFGLPLLAIPAITAAASLPMALSIAVFPVIATNFWQLWRFRAHRDQPFLSGFLVAGAVGLVAGAAVLSLVRDAYLEIALGALVLLYLLTRTRAPKAAPARIAPPVGFLAGAVHGATGLSGLVGTPYLHAMKLERPAFVFANGAMFTLFSTLHVPTLAALGLYQPAAIWMGLLTLPAAFAGLWIGGRLGAQLSTQGFARVVIAILTLAAIIPIVNGTREIMAL